MKKLLLTLTLISPLQAFATTKGYCEGSVNGVVISLGADHFAFECDLEKEGGLKSPCLDNIDFVKAVLNAEEEISGPTTQYGKNPVKVECFPFYSSIL